MSHILELGTLIIAFISMAAEKLKMNINEWAMKNSIYVSSNLGIHHKICFIIFIRTIRGYNEDYIDENYRCCIKSSNRMVFNMNFLNQEVW